MSSAAAANKPTVSPPPAGGQALPAIARRLGYAGLAPFVLGALLVWLVYDDLQTDVARAVAAYAAVIVSFLGGIHWGLAMRLPAAPHPPNVLLGWGVVPSLVAWPAVWMPPGAGLVILGVMLVVCYAVDRVLYPQQGVAHWLVLRFRLSAIAALSCFIAAAGS